MGQEIQGNRQFPNYDAGYRAIPLTFSRVHRFIGPLSKPNIWAFLTSSKTSRFVD